MNKLIVLLLLAMTSSISISAQNSTRYSQESISQEYSSYITALKSFVSSLENVPVNFTPQKLNEYEAYLGEDASTSIQHFNQAYGDLIAYLVDYENYHGEGSLQTFFDNELKKVEKLPSCFSSWYTTEVQITAKAVSCCFTSEGCPLCRVGGSTASTSNMIVFEQCMQQYNGNP